MDGIDVINKIRDVSEAKVIVVSAIGYEREKVYALDTGADDCLTKPFSVPELLDWIRVSLRQKSKTNSSETENMKSFEVRGLKIDFEKYEVSVDGKPVHLTPIEFKLLELLSKNAEKVLTHRFIINKIWERILRYRNTIFIPNLIN